MFDTTTADENLSDVTQAHIFTDEVMFKVLFTFKLVLLAMTAVTE